MTTNRFRTLVLGGTLTALSVLAGCSAGDRSVAAGDAGGAGTVHERATSTIPPRLDRGSTPATADVPVSPSSAPPTVTADVGAPVVPAGSPQTTIPEPNTTLTPPDPTVVPTIPPTGDDPALIDCGVVYRASGWPTTFVPSPSTFACLANAFAAGTPARLVDREQTDGYGGAILITTYDVLGPGDLRMTVDATNAADRPQVVTVSRCTGVVAEMMSLVVSGCTVIG